MKQLLIYFILNSFQVSKKKIEFFSFFSSSSTPSFFFLLFFQIKQKIYKVISGLYILYSELEQSLQKNISVK